MTRKNRTPEENTQREKTRGRFRTQGLSFKRRLLYQLRQGRVYAYLQTSVTYSLQHGRTYPA